MKSTPKTKPRKRLILAIDPAKKAGVAVLLDGKLVGAAPSSGDKFPPLLETVRLLTGSYQDIPESERAAIVEAGWMGPSRGAHTLAKRRGIAEAACQACGFDDVADVTPKRWHKALYGWCPPRGETKAEAFRYVQQHFGFRPESDDVAEAICLADFYCKLLSDDSE